MKLQRRVAIWSGVISVLSFLLALLFYMRNAPFTSNVFIGLFSSGLLICISSVVTYFNEREKELIALYLGCDEFLSSILKNARKDNQVEVHKLKENFDTMVKIYNNEVFLHVDHLELLCHHSKAYHIVAKIWRPVASVYSLILDDRDIVTDFIIGDTSEQDLRSYQWKHYSKDAGENIKQLYTALDELADYLHYFEHIEKGKAKRIEVLKNAD